METPNNPEIKADLAAPEVKTEETPTEPQAPSQETPPEPKPKPAPKPVEQKFSKRERLEHAKEKIESQIEDLEAEEDDNRPVTLGELKRRDAEKAKETAIELAESIEDEDEREQVIDLLESRITPSGDSQKDLELARGAVNSIKNTQILEEQQRKATPGQHASAPGAPGKPEDRFEPTANEQVFMKPPYNLSKEDIIKARNQEQA